MRGYSDEQYQWLADNAWQYTRDELAKAFNAKYGANKSGEAIRSLGKKAKWPYRKTHWAKGLSKEEFISHFTDESMAKRTEHFRAYYNKKLKTGELFERNGELYIVTDDTTHVHITERSQQYDRYLYEQTHGIKLRPRDLIVHVDGNKMNNDVDNLEMLPMEMLVTYSRYMASPEGKENPIINKACLRTCRLEYELKKQK